MLRAMLPHRSQQSRDLKRCHSTKVSDCVTARVGAPYRHRYRPPVRVSASTSFDDVGTSIAHQRIVKIRSNDININERCLCLCWRCLGLPISSRASYQNQQSYHSHLEWDVGLYPLAASGSLSDLSCRQNSLLPSATLSWMMSMAARLNQTPFERYLRVHLD